ncbi:MAG: hypothetical protein JXB05_31790 [Myxococcaceae bacterium]|nr:hypothetical protein [Myxococcaceae bacterium]
MESTPDTATPSGPELMGRLLRSVADLPREPSTDILVTQAFLQADSRALQSREFRMGLAACLSRLRHPGDEEARAQDAAQWEVLLSEPLGEQLLADPRLPPEQRLANLSFFLLRPELPLALLSPYAGNLTSVAAHEAQLALQAFPPEQVAPIARFPPALVARFPELAALTQPVEAQAIAVLVPHVLRPDQAARLVDSLADDILGAALDDSPVLEHRRTFAALAAEGLRRLAEQLRTETLPQQVAQLLVLGGLQHQAFFQNLAPFTQDALARLEPPQGTVSAVDGVAREMIFTSVALLGMALAGPIGVAAAGMISRGASQAVDALRAGGRLPLGALAGEVLGVPGLGLAPHSLGEVVAALTQLYATWLAGLGDEAADLLGADLMQLLLRGEVEGLGEAWAALLGDAERVAALQGADAETRAEVLRVLLVGGALGAFSWEAVTPALQAHGQAIFGHGLPADLPPATAAALHASSAARAVAVLANDELLEQLTAGTLSPSEALVEARGLGASLFVGGAEPDDPTLTTAMVGALAPPGPGSPEEAEVDASPEEVDASPEDD